MPTAFERVIARARGIIQKKHGESFMLTPRKKNGPNAGGNGDPDRTVIPDFTASWYQMPEDVRPDVRGQAGFAMHMPHVGADLSIFYSIADCPEAKNGDYITRLKGDVVYKITKIQPDGVGGGEMILALAK